MSITQNNKIRRINDSTLVVGADRQEGSRGSGH
jgi:hypothetical protein